MMVMGRGRALVVAAVSAVLIVGTTGSAQAADDNTLSLSIAPTVPEAGISFQVTASGIATDDQVMYLLAVLAPGEEPCQPTAALEEATYYDHLPDARWGRAWTNWVGGTRPDHAEYEVQALFAGRPLGKYRVCGYLYGSEDPAADARLDLTVGGTCSAATKRVSMAERTYGRKVKILQRKRHALRDAKAHHRPRHVVQHARKQVTKAKRATAVAARHLEDARADQQALC